MRHDWEGEIGCVARALNWIVVGIVAAGVGGCVKQHGGSASPLRAAGFSFHRCFGPEHGVLLGGYSYAEDNGLVTPETAVAREWRDAWKDLEGAGVSLGRCGGGMHLVLATEPGMVAEWGSPLSGTMRPSALKGRDSGRSPDALVARSSTLDGLTTTMPLDRRILDKDAPESWRHSSTAVMASSGLVLVVDDLGLPIDSPLWSGGGGVRFLHADGHVAAFHPTRSGCDSWHGVGAGQHRADLQEGHRELTAVKYGADKLAVLVGPTGDGIGVVAEYSAGERRVVQTTCYAVPGWIAGGGHLGHAVLPVHGTDGTWMLAPGQLNSVDDTEAAYSWMENSGPEGAFETISLADPALTWGQTPSLRRAYVGYGALVLVEEFNLAHGRPRFATKVYDLQTGRIRGSATVEKTSHTSQLEVMWSADGLAVVETMVPEMAMLRVHLGGGKGERPGNGS